MDCPASIVVVDDDIDTEGEESTEMETDADPPDVDPSYVYVPVDEGVQV